MVAEDQGRTVAVSEADLLDGSGRSLAVGTATCLLINPDPT
jgi:acyl-coenzyme A thioesterase PaaI-like protein